MAAVAAAADVRSLATQFQRSRVGPDRWRVLISVPRFPKIRVVLYNRL